MKSSVIKTYLLLIPLHSLVSSLRRFFGERSYILLLSVIVGTLAGFAAVAMKYLTIYFHSYGNFLAKNAISPWLVPAIPFLGVFACVLFVKLWIRGPYEKGLAGVIENTSHGSSEIPLQKTYSHILTSSVSIGMGTSGGLEAPIVLTGSAIGSNFAKILMLGRESRTLLLACGGAAGLSAVFDSPVAGVLFACEILLPAFSIPALIPLLMASAAAAVVSKIFYSHQTFSMTVPGWETGNLPYYILLGIFAGLISAYVISISLKAYRRFEFMKKVWFRAAIGCLFLYVCFLFFPMLKGEGYGFINHLINGENAELMTGSPLAFVLDNKWLFIILIGVLVFVKGAVSVVSIQSGGDGGMFAPSMFMGAFLGYALAQILILLGAEHIKTTNFIAAGMGGVLAGVMHAPMTGIFLIAEITGGYMLLVPLMIVSSLSYFVCKKIFPYNIYKSVIAERGGTPEPNQNTLAASGVPLANMIERDFLPVKPDDTLRVVVQTVVKSRHNIFPVVDDEGKLEGVIVLDNIRQFLLNEQLYDIVLAYDIMIEPGPLLKASDSLSDAAALFESLKTWNLPVVNSDGKYVGFISKSGVFDQYREILKTKQELF